VELVNGSQFWADQLWISGAGLNESAAVVHGINVGSSYGGFLYLGKSTIQDMPGHGIWLQGGKGYSITGTSFGGCGQFAANTYDDLHIASGVSHVSVSGCHFDTDPFNGIGSPAARSAVYAESGAASVGLSGCDILTSGYGTAQVVDPGGVIYQGGGNTGWVAPPALQAPWVPSDNLLLAASQDPKTVGNSSQILSAGALYLIKLNIRQNMTLSKTWWYVSTAGSGTSTGTYSGLYSSAGSLLTGSADAATALSTAGAASISLSAPQTLAAGTFVWAGILSNLSGTQPTLTRTATLIGPVNFGLSLSAAQACVNGTGLTALPGSITPSANTTSGAFPFFAGGS